VVKAVGVKNPEDIEKAGGYDLDAILLDAHAPQVFGGTGEKFDWGLALEFKKRFPEVSLILAGGITPQNAASAISEVRPAALDVASGAEVSPGVKDFDKVRQLLEACRGVI
jgi:phosphoribosylanthranilate isomerase